MDKLAEFRAALNNIDEQLISLLGQRFNIIREVGQHKKQNHIPMMQAKRVDDVKDRCAKLGEQHHLDDRFVRELYTLIINEACRIEDIIIDQE